MPPLPDKKNNAFVLISTDHGTMIVNRYDYCAQEDGRFYGVGRVLMEFSAFDREEVYRLVDVLHARRMLYGDGVVAIDGGANVGVHTLTWARAMIGWGSVIAFEAQERIYYALAGNIALNNLINAQALHLALAAREETLAISPPNYMTPGSFGSFGLRDGKNEDVGQTINGNTVVHVRAVPIDLLALPRLDLLKLDIEGMEIEALEGCRQTIQRCRPVIFAEWVKSDKAQLVSMISAFDYDVFEYGINLIGVHKTDPTLTKLS